MQEQRPDTDAKAAATFGEGGDTTIFSPIPPFFPPLPTPTMENFRVWIFLFSL